MLVRPIRSIRCYTNTPMTRQFTAAANKREGHTHVLLITTGSVASIKAPLIVEELLKVSN
jgi:hypothetical protein